MQGAYYRNIPLVYINQKIILMASIGKNKCKNKKVQLI